MSFVALHGDGRHTIPQTVKRCTVERLTIRQSASLPGRSREFAGIAGPPNVRQSLLDHRSFRTTEKYYIQAQTIEAGRSFAKIIAASHDRHGVG